MSPTHAARRRSRPSPSRTGSALLAGGERKARHHRAQLLQPRAQPAALEAGMAGQEDARVPARIAGSITRLFHWRLARDHSALRGACLIAQRIHRLPEARVDIGRAVGHPVAQASPAAPAPILSYRRRSDRPTSGESTKKPPLIQPPSSSGFSRKLVTLSPSMSSAPKRAGRTHRDSHRCRRRAP